MLNANNKHIDPYGVDSQVQSHRRWTENKSERLACMAMRTLELKRGIYRVALMHVLKCTTIVDVPCKMKQKPRTNNKNAGSLAASVCGSRTRADRDNDVPVPGYYCALGGNYPPPHHALCTKVTRVSTRGFGTWSRS